MIAHKLHNNLKSSYIFSLALHLVLLNFQSSKEDLIPLYNSYRAKERITHKQLHSKSNSAFTTLTIARLIIYIIVYSTPTVFIKLNFNLRMISNLY